ncbi:class I SAM-dependent methyltransferase [Natronobiforma cellulositropha]|uniref:class I SAM-dependent methyltransferase n=1 Tax=Natronobiforma cellulositropha TaxID=1679076 RepID=UPI0021D60458|nr:class I SAM-dependent methyltransferase [Natronobiforma cellulositropha]
MTGGVSTTAYLLAKRTVDDRALDRRVLERFASALADRPDGAPVSILEVGAGPGTMVARLAARRCLPPSVSYRAIDRDPDCIALARERLPRWLSTAGYRVEWRGDDLLVARDGERTLAVTLEVGDAFAVTDEVDAVVSGAFLDIVDLASTVDHFRDVLADGGLVYAPITFDGETGFAPRDPRDERVLTAYHRHMDAVRDEPGSSRRGREFLFEWPAAGGSVLAAGGGDWIVRPLETYPPDATPDGARGYPADEARVLEYLLETVEGALADYPPSVVDPTVYERWLGRRRAELERAELVFVAHNLDVLARV